MNERWTLEGKKALLTGGTRGIGRGIVEAFTSWGAEVIFTARNPDEVKKLEVDLQAAGYLVRGFAGDISLADDRDRLVSEIRNITAELDILVNNAGTNIRKPTTDYDDEEIRKIMDTNLNAAFALTRKCHPMLKQAGHASVIMLSSVAGLGHMRTGSVYGMTKAAMIQLTKNLAVEWASDGIRVNAIAPWYIKTEFASSVMSKPDYYQSVVSRTPMKRIGEIHEVSDAVSFLCMPAASYITGQVLAVDGGVSVDMF